MRVTKYLIAASALSLAFTATAHAETAEEAAAETADRDGDAITVNGERLNKETSILSSRAPTSIYGTGETLLNTPRSVTQINTEQLTKDIITSSDDLAKYAPGITRGGGQNAGIVPTLRAQGSEVFQDGQRGYAVRHPANFNAYEGADIVAGPSSVIFGSVTGSGGYINYLTKKPDFDQRRSSLTTRIGSIIPDGKSKFGFTVTGDDTAPISDTLAYRTSITVQKQDDYYDKVKNNFYAFYGALAWKPASNFRADLNASYDNYYDWNVTHGWNRATQSLVDDGLYYAGRATPIIQNGSTYWSPVFASGDANSATTGWVQRARNSAGQYVVVDGTFQTASPNTQTSPGTVRGWVYDPTLEGNELTKISRQRSQRAEDQNTSRRFTAQLKLNWDVGEHTSLVNSTFYERSSDTTDATGSFQVQSRDRIFDNRLEVRHSFEFGGGIVDDSNTGVIYRRETNRSISANNSFGTSIYAYDLTLDPSTKNPGDLLGITTANPNGGNAAWIGTAGQPQYSNYFGWLSLPPMYYAGNGLYAESVAAYTSQTAWTTITAFTQHNLKFGDFAGLNVGGSRSWVDASIRNPFPLPGASERKDDGDYTLYSVQVSPYVKPTASSTIYFTYDRSIAINTGLFSNGLTWGSGAAANLLNPLQFKSLSELYEVGIKAEPIAGQLFVTLSGFKQARDQSPDQFNNIARLKVKGIETTLRYQPSEAWRTGLNFNYLSAYNEYTSQAGFAPRGFVADNGTVFSDSNVLNQLPAGRFDAVQIPKYNLSGYLDWRHPSGFGAELSGWLTSPWYLNLSKTVRIPTSYNLDLGLFYRQPRWNAQIQVQNLTDQLNFVSGLTGSTNTFLQPTRGRSITAQFGFNF
ncbi:MULTISPECIES: TonB-dependent receptor [Novosphingobium]|uniref:TonB-dependent receptor n=1 Tax=Novosphingobium TaxID=165696 RepID=UPI0022F280CB|nr:TonB-dependent receptor plug domain-containing protein [Novosphingobium resinovorum]GLK44908.1 TonB-dependent receptor [Novosphingobium resinovorum]